MSGTMGRRRQTRHDLPPRMHQKGDTYYYVTSTTPRKWIKLDKDLGRAKIMWAQLENDGATDRFHDALDAWMVSPAYNELTASSKTTYGSVIKQLKEFFDGFGLLEIKPVQVAQWMDNHPSKTQANTGKAILSKVFEMAIRRGWAETNPCRDIKRNTIKPRDRYLTDQEFKAIREKGNEVVKIAMDLAYLTGARISDILKATLADCQDEGFFIKQKKTGAKQLFEWTPELETVINEAKKMPRPVRGLHALICNRYGQPYPYGTFNDYWLEAVRDAGIENAQFRDIRAKTATDAEHQGKDHQKLLGHTTKAMSDRYVKVRKVTRVTPMKKVV